MVSAGATLATHACVTRVAIAALLLGACSFSATPASNGGAPDANGVTVDGPTYFVGCHITDPSLRLCLDFEDPVLAPIVKDGSTFRHDATTVNLVPMTRSGEQAAMFSSTSSATIPATPDFGPPALSLEAWMKPDSIISTSWAIYDAQHYALGISGSSITCGVGNKVVSVDATPYANQWVHVACTSTAMKLTLYVNGNAVDCNSGTKTMGASSLGIGVGLSGGIDNVRLFAAALPAATICTHAGQTGCTVAAACHPE